MHKPEHEHELEIICHMHNGDLGWYCGECKEFICCRLNKHD